jgi:hypothetical protein
MKKQLNVRSPLIFMVLWASTLAVFAQSPPGDLDMQATWACQGKEPTSRYLIDEMTGRDELHPRILNAVAKTARGSSSSLQEIAECQPREIVLPDETLQSVMASW